MQTCRQHHEAIRSLLERFPTRTPLDPGAVSSLLARVGRAVATHLQLEDDHLYPALEQSAEREVRETAIRYRVEMGDLKSQFASLLDAWSTEASIAAAPEAFMAQWLPVRKALEIRMAKEDHGLYAIAEDYLERNDIA
ncbi:MAG: hypothetical protein NVS1B14_10290 [Vulcanimicrobiaceae bacterium]